VAVEGRIRDKGEHAEQHAARDHRRPGRIGPTGAFATSRTAQAGNLKLEVKGVGRIAFPITAAAACKLCEAAQPARHGYKDQTRLDRRVRDSREVQESKISIDEHAWSKTLQPQLDRIRRDLGLPAGCTLRASLHDLLVYAPDQFFVTQDSEKTDDMIAALVVSLPSRSTGGAMLIGHHEERLRVGGSGTNLIFTAFYADCHHEVRPVEQGYRVVLTCNLTLAGDTSAGASAAQVDELARCVHRFFETPLPAQWRGDTQQGLLDRLVCLLDHQYSQRGLAWDRLRGADAVRAAALREAARSFDCETFLALADAHETWSCESDDWDDDYAHGDGDAADEDDDGMDALAGVGGKPMLTDLTDRDVELRHWIDADGRPEAVVGCVEARELCWTKPSVELAPFENSSPRRRLPRRHGSGRPGPESQGWPSRRPKRPPGRGSGRRGTPRVRCSNSSPSVHRAIAKTSRGTLCALLTKRAISARMQEAVRSSRSC
jgi:sarcosine oxidase gamma subunit